MIDASEKRAIEYLLNGTAGALARNRCVEATRIERHSFGYGISR